MSVDRRTFLQGSGSIALAGAITGFPSIARGAGRRVVIIGGGTGGATAAKYMGIADRRAEVVLIEPNKIYHTCYMSNEVLSGRRDISTIAHNYAGLEDRGIKVFHDLVIGIDPLKKMVRTQSGGAVEYERCIVSPGIDFKWDAIKGYDAEVAQKIPHAWKAGDQTAMLLAQLQAMKDGGTVILVPPTNPFRCPPGPYERASQIASYLKVAKPKSKILILDPKDKFSKQGLFIQAWKKLYGYGGDNAMIEWVAGSSGGKIESVDAGSMSIEADIETHKGDVINVVPPQKAGAIAFLAGLTKGDWCPVNKKTFESLIHPGVHVIGDAASAAKMPKSGYAANSQAKVAAFACASLLQGQEPPEPSYVNTCYSIAGKDYAFSVAAVYTYDAAKNQIVKVKGSGGLTPSDASADQLRLEELYAHSWYNNITHDAFG